MTAQMIITWKDLQRQKATTTRQGFPGSNRESRHEEEYLDPLRND